MATTVATFASTAHTGAYANQTRIDRMANGVLWMLLGDKVNDWLRLYRSTNNGSSWTEDTGARITAGVVSAGASLRVASRFDGNERVAIAYRRSSDNRITVAFAYPDNAAKTSLRWHPHSPKVASRLKGDSDFTRPDLDVYWAGDAGWLIPVVWGELQGSSGRLWMGRVRFLPSAAYATDERIIHSRSSMSTFPRPSCAIRHLGDDTLPYSASPDLYVSHDQGIDADPNDRTYHERFTLSGTTWSGTGRHWYDDAANSGLIASTFTGQRFVTVRARAGNTSEIRMLLMTPEDASREEINVPSLGQNEITSISVTHDSYSFDIYILAAGTTNQRPHIIRYDWLTRSWDSWTQINTDTVRPDSLTAKPGSKAKRIEISYVILPVAGSLAWRYELATLSNVKPKKATWNVASGTFDRNATLLHDWSHNDPDGDVQVQYELTRQINGGTINYWNGSTWQAGVAQPTSAATSVTEATAWGTDGDTHTYRVRTNDGQAWGPQSAVRTVLASVKVDPSWDTPAAGTLNTGTPTFAWTVAEQSDYRIRALIGGIEQWSTDWINDPAARSFLVPDELALVNGQTYSIEITTRNDEGLESAPATRAFTISLTPPPTPTKVVTALTAQGALQIVITNGTLLNTNVGFETNLDEWQGTSAGVTRERSTEQARSGVASQKITPNGTDAIAQAFTLHDTPVLFAATPGRTYAGEAWSFTPDGYDDTSIVLDFRDDANVSQGTAISSTIATPAGVWTRHYVSGVAPANTTQVRLFLRAGDTPVVSDVVYWDDARILESFTTGEAETSYNRVYQLDADDPEAVERLIFATVGPDTTVIDREVRSARNYDHIIEAVTLDGATARST